MNGTSRDWNIKDYLRKLREERIKEYGLQSLIVSFDGMSGTGKDVQIARTSGTLKSQYSGIRVLDFRESTYVKSSERINYLNEISEGAEENLDRTVDLYTKDRIKAWEQHVIPAAQSEGIILLDRSVYTTLALQIFLRDLHKKSDKRQLMDLTERLFPKPIVPSARAIFTVCEVNTAYDRIAERERRRATAIKTEAEDPVHRYEREIYSRRTENKEFTDENAIKWWLTNTKTTYKWLVKSVPDGVQVLTGRNTIRVNPVILAAVNKSYSTTK